MSDALTRLTNIEAEIARLTKLKSTYVAFKSGVVNFISAIQKDPSVGELPHPDVIAQIIERWEKYQQANP